jgi:hypothetical protein
MPDSLTAALKGMATSTRKDDILVRLRAVERLEKEFKAAEKAELRREAAIVANLISSAWMKVAPNFFWLEGEARQQQERGHQRGTDVV